MEEVFKKEGIKRIERIRKKTEFKKIFNSATKINSEKINIYYSKNKSEISRFAVVTSKRLGNAVVRNKIKRSIREVYRRQKGYFHKGIDWIFVPQGKWEKINYLETKRLLLDVIKGIKEGKNFINTG